MRLLSKLFRPATSTRLQRAVPESLGSPDQGPYYRADKSSKTAKDFATCSSDASGSQSAPPSYSSAPPEYSRVVDDDQAYQKLAEYDTIFLVDDSSSMSYDTPSGKTRWQEARLALAEFAEIAAKYDEDGIDIYFINNPKGGLGMKGPGSVNALFPKQPYGRTDIGKRLHELVPATYLTELEAASREEAPWPKRRNYMIITDGEATDPQVLRKFLRRLATNLAEISAPQNQIGFQFIQIGNDRRATAFLEELDGDGQELPTDIVDTLKAEPGEIFDARILKKALLGGINRNFDYKH